MLAKKCEIPICLKVSYAEQLELKLSVPQKFQIQKFARHWIMMTGFYQYQEEEITKRYLSYLNEGDLVKIKGNHIKTDWKQKNVRKQQGQNQHQMDFGFHLQIPQTYRMTKNKYFQQSDIKKILKQLTKFYEEDMNKQMDGLKVISIFIHMDSQNPFIIKILDFVRDQNNSNVFVNLFVNEINTIHDKEYNFIDKWVSFHSVLTIERDMRFMFHRLSKITVKKISFNLKCFDGELCRRKLKSNKNGESQWNLQNNILSYELNYPQCNRIYINAIQLRNLGYQQCYKFQLTLDCLDVNDRSFRATKSFKLKPQRTEFELIRTPDYHKQNDAKIRQACQIEYSLKYENVQLFDKIEDLKEICERIQIEIKNNTNFTQNEDEEEDKIKTLHSFQM